MALPDRHEAPPKVGFLETFAANLASFGGEPALYEVRESRLVPMSGDELAALVARARATMRELGVGPGDRVVLLAPNRFGWVAADLAILFERAITVPMYARQAPAELVEMMHDCQPKAVLCADDGLADAVRAHWKEAPITLFDTLFASDPVEQAAPLPRAPDDVATIIYTSGTSGTPKGVMLSASNINMMLPITRDALQRLNSSQRRHDRVFHYLPFCFAGSRVVLWTMLYRANPLMMSTDLDALPAEMKAAKPNYFLNVPALLERIKTKVDATLRGKPKPVKALYEKAFAAHKKKAAGGSWTFGERVACWIADRVIFGTVRDQIGRELEFLICGSAPLGPDTQVWFEMLEIPVYQVYGLTETTAIVTMDRPPDVPAGQVGFAIDGVEMKLGEGDELLVRGPNIFKGYWNRFDESRAAMDGDWFRTGDQCELDRQGRLKVIGRVKNLLVPSSGHNVAPEPIEARLVAAISGVQQAVVIGHGRPYLTAILTGEVTAAAVAAGLEVVNGELPHYRRIRRTHVSDELLSIENGLLTANSKLKRRAIEKHFEEEIEGMYA